MDMVGVLFVLLGLMALAAALLPRLLSRAPVSMPMVVLGGGIALFAVVPGLPTPDPLSHGTLSTHLSEVCVIVSLMGAGLAIDRPVSRVGWSSTWRLLAITMTLSIAIVAAAGIVLLGLGVAAAILLAAALAPTDPVLASEVQVAEPAEDADQPDEDEARFALTSEAGLNDGLAFPFTYLALGVAAAGALTWPVFGHWVGIDLGWRLCAGVAVGLLVGWLLRRLFFNTPVPSLRLADHAEGFVALAATFLAYGTAEAVEGYGFLAVFVCACTIRAGERSHGYHRVLHSWVEQLERLLTVLLLLLLGGAIARGLLIPLQPVDVVVVVGFLVLIRPLLGWLGLIGGRTGPRERAVIAFFGVRGIGTLFYIAYALGHGTFDHTDRLWAIAGLTVACSVVLHGITATPAMMLLDRTRQKATQDRHGTTEHASDTAV
ncbi:cation:proton antiporter [Microlunatus ginsengisoli]|uniref:Cation:proton antiporter n=1 Tax=Microlunatus ginsengisoli TaxID=363863 RepID=A0ABP7AXU9_9ACTN